MDVAIVAIMVAMAVALEHVAMIVKHHVMTIARKDVMAIK